MRTLKDKTIVITGGSRGIGEAIALRAARDGANVALLAKTLEPHPSLPGTLLTEADAVEKAGGKALPLQVDVRFEDQIRAAIDQTVQVFGGIDILVNNASAIFLARTEDTPVKRWDLMNQVNARATFLMTQACLPHLRHSSNPHVLVMSPPPRLEPAWFGAHLPYTLSKYAMSLCVLGWAEEFRHEGIGVNALWPRWSVATAAVRNVLGGDESLKQSCLPTIMADAAWSIVTRKSRECTGNFFIDDDVLMAEGETDFAKYAVEPGNALLEDLFV
jgi:citronellol/citronellal dehydrogenase